ncbi:hypothetical protein L3X38_020584 [Prunus dulcis]|uniref:Uncharacterized protein n=1 Tax=Prunus dulcis TaxID=3755 RepID=A0AAD4WD56_PRUDU|nr:hypothetical protein L3X38_020584 [Prunus dulcis]
MSWSLMSLSLMRRSLMSLSLMRPNEPEPDEVVVGVLAERYDEEPDEPEPDELELDEPEPDEEEPDEPEPDEEQPDEVLGFASLVDLLELHSASAIGGVYDAESFSVSKLKLRAMAFSQLTIGNSALLFLINPRPLPGLFEFVEFVDACMAVFAHIAMEAVEFVNLSSDEIDNLQFSCSNLQFVLVASFTVNRRSV